MGQKCTGSQITSEGHSSAGRRGLSAPGAIAASPSNVAKIAVFCGGGGRYRLAAEAQGLVLSLPPSVGWIVRPQHRQSCRQGRAHTPREAQGAQGTVLCSSWSSLLIQPLSSALLSTQAAPRIFISKPFCGMGLVLEPLL